MPNPFDSGYFRETELRDFGFRAIGNNVQIAKNCTIVGLENISIADNVRIDGYCSILAGGTGSLSIGSFVHIGAYCMLSAGDGIQLDDFSGLSQGVRIYSRSDDYSGRYLTNPTVPAQYTNISRGQVTLGRHVIIGSGTIVLPDLSIGEGSSVGALSLVTRSLDSWGVYAGTPARRLKSRSNELLRLEAELRQTQTHSLSKQGKANSAGEDEASP